MSGQSPRSPGRASAKAGGRTTLSVFDVSSRTLRAAGDHVAAGDENGRREPGRDARGRFREAGRSGDRLRHPRRASGDGLGGRTPRFRRSSRCATTDSDPERRWPSLPAGLLVIGSESGVVLIVDPATGAEVRRMTGAPPLTSNDLAAVSKDGTTLLTTGTRGVAVWDLMSYRSVVVESHAGRPVRERCPGNDHRQGALRELARRSAVPRSAQWSSDRPDVRPAGRQRLGRGRDSERPVSSSNSATAGRSWDGGTSTARAR